MSLLHAILKKVQSNETICKKYPSPPPEINKVLMKTKNRNRLRRKYDHVKAVVDMSPPHYNPLCRCRVLENWGRNARVLMYENMKLLTQIKKQHFMRGVVDSRWSDPPPGSRQYIDNRNNFYKRLMKGNKYMFHVISNAKPRVCPTACLRRDWCRNQIEIINKAPAKFVLFQTISEEVEDVQFKAPPGIERPKVYITLRVQDGANIGILPIELFTDVCPLTCQLFLDLADGDGLGNGYIGTQFFRKVPNLFWTGGDVIYNNGFGCYAQRGRVAPIGAENYHFPHSIPGLLSMRMTRNDEMCGIFNITFKPLLQFDLKNVVFGRVLRPNSTYDIIRSFGSPRSTHPVVEIVATRRRIGNKWVCGQPNKNLSERSEKSLRCKIKS